MTPYYQQDHVTLLLGDCRDVLAQLPAESVSCCATSPPFWGLRKYDCPPSIWGGDPECPHTLDAQPMSDEGYAGRKRWQHDGVSRQETPEAWVRTSGPVHPRQRRCKSCRKFGVTTWLANDVVSVWCEPCGLETLYRGADSKELKGIPHDSTKGNLFSWEATEPVSQGATCSLCGAWRGHYGLEPTVAMYVEHTVEVLRAIRRVLRKDGVCWWDLDDSRHGSWGDYVKGGENKNKRSGKRWTRPGYEEAAFHEKPPTAARGALHKSLCLIPQRVAIAAQEDGWIVRSQIIIPSWMPESARDRPTDAYRVVLMLCKQKAYWYDAAAVRVAGADPERERWERVGGDNGGRPVHSPGAFIGPSATRNLGNIWTLPPSSYPAAHFATFCLEEPELCIKASCPAEVCVNCGKARVRIVAKGLTAHDGETESGYAPGGNTHRLALLRQAARERGGEYTQESGTLGWTDCGCRAGFEPGLVLDPFMGTGTTAIAARKLGRRCIGIDLSEDYLKQAVTRLTVGDAGVRLMVKAARGGAKQEVLL